MYTNILIPIAFEDDRDVAGAIDVAKCLSGAGASITFIHVIEQIPIYATEFVAPDMLTGSRDKIAERLATLAATVPAGRVAVVDGGAGRGITEWATQNAVDCIVIASHRPVFSDILLGSTAAWVVRHAQCAVHVIR
ncbi:MAG: universal stress protein [Pseudomonadota bacterium]